MLVEGITPDHHTFDILLMTCWKQRRFNLANELFDKAVQLNADKGKLVRANESVCKETVRTVRLVVTYLNWFTRRAGARHTPVQLGVARVHPDGGQEGP
jgi:hypothetical protein